MKKNLKIITGFALLMFLYIGCCKDTTVKKACDSCKPRTHCENDSCVLDKGYYYSNANGTGEIIQLLDDDFSDATRCFYTNYSFRDTPWLTPRYFSIGLRNSITDTFISAGGRALEIFFGRMDATSYNFDYLPPIIYRDNNGKVKRIVLFQTNDDSQVRLMPNDSMLPYGKTRTIWDGIVSEDYKEINFTVKFIQPEFGAIGGRWSDTFKVIKNYIMTKDPTNRADCKFCE